MTSGESTYTVVKHDPDGRERARYQGAQIPSRAGWIAVRADWVHGEYDLGYLHFRNGDYLNEYFALTRPYNAFALFRETGEFQGWYCNVTHPTDVSGQEIRWHDLYVDVIVYPDGRTLVLDEDELAESGLESSDPALHAMILAARDELLQLARDHSYPFSEIPRD